MTQPAGRVRTFKKISRVESAGARNVTGRVGSGRVGLGQEVFKYDTSGRVTLTRFDPTRLVKSPWKNRRLPTTGTSLSRLGRGHVPEEQCVWLSKTRGRRGDTTNRSATRSSWTLGYTAIAGWFLFRYRWISKGISSLSHRQSHPTRMLSLV